MYFNNMVVKFVCYAFDRIKNYYLIDNANHCSAVAKYKMSIFYAKILCINENVSKYNEIKSEDDIYFYCLKNYVP